MKAKELYPSIFGRHALEYRRRLEEVMSRGEARGRLRALELLNARPGMRILDIASGPGTLTGILAAAVAPGGEVVGVDLAAGMIEEARRSSPANARFEVMDMEHLDFEPGSFDAAVCGHGLQFAPDLERALAEARRVIRPGGVLAATVPAVGIGDSVWDVVEEVVKQRLPPSPDVVDDKMTRAIVRDAEAFKAVALRAGFSSARLESIEEEVVWDSADHLFTNLMGWWDFAYRIDRMDAASRQAFKDEATARLRRDHPGSITTHGVTLVLLAH